MKKEERLMQKERAEMKEVEWEREERIALLGATGSGALSDANSDERGYHRQLPHMRDDVLAFFHALEKTLHLNNVLQTEWAKLLPPLLNAKAAKYYNHLTIDQSKNFEFVKKTILTSFRLTPATYLQSLNR